MTSPISEAQLFLAPVLDRTQLLSLRNASLIQRLSIHIPSPPPPEDTKALTRAVLTHTLRLLQEIHVSSAPAPSSQPDPNKLVNATEARMVVCLLDLLVLEGIYPSLSTGVGIPLERRARNFVLPATRKKVVEVEDNRDLDILKSVMDGLLQVLESTGRDSVGKTIRERCLVDVLAGCGELAFGPDGTDEWKVRWEKLVDSTPTPLLLPQLLSLLHPSIPPSFRGPLTRTLSTLPIIRPNAIRHILELFLSTVSDSALSVDALSNASRIIGSVPSSVNASEYFSKVCPQLLGLLDGKDPGLARAAGFVTVELLGRRGAIEKIVEREIVDIIVAGLNPTQEQKSALQEPATIPHENRKTSSALLAFEDAPPPQKNSLIKEITDRPSLISILPDSVQEDPPLVSEEALTTTLHRISLLLSSHPSPSVSQRLLPPIILPLWALLSYAKQTSRSSWHERALSLLKTHIKTTPTTNDESVLSTLHHNILFTGAHWEFGSGSLGGVEIRRRTSDKGLDMSMIESRVEEFLSLLSDSEIAEGALNEFFLSILRMWLQRRNGEGEDPIVMFTTLKVLQEMISRHEGALAKSPTQTLQIVKGVLDEYVDWNESLKKASKEGAGLGPSLGGLGKIVSGVASGITPKRKQRKFIDEDEEEEQDEETERVETVTMALSLLSVLISSPGTKLTSADERLIQTLQPPLSYISNSPEIHADLSSLAINIASLLSLHEPATATPTSSLIEQQKESYILALSYLRDPLIPVRAHGLHLLRELILAMSPVVDIPSTMRLLIGMLKDGDSFVYLNVVKCLTALTDKHSKTVTRMLVDAYTDDTPGTERLGLDERLRIGEALLSTVQRLGGALVGDTAEMIGVGMLDIVSRRRKREGGAGGEEWGSDEEEEEAEDVDEAVKEKRRQESAHKTRIVRGWQGVGQTEDLRIRTSALSILGAAIETNAQGLGQSVLTEAIDTSLSILTLETVTEKAILRRAAVVCIGSILKSLVGLNDETTGDDENRWREGVWEVIRERVGEVRRVLGYVRGADNDGLVREQSGIVGENLEAVVERWMLGRRQGAGGRRIVEIGDGDFGGLKVL